jgi:hypothetical protein
LKSSAAAGRTASPLHGTGCGAQANERSTCATIAAREEHLLRRGLGTTNFCNSMHRTSGTGSKLRTLQLNARKGRNELETADTATECTERAEKAETADTARPRARSGVTMSALQQKREGLLGRRAGLGARRPAPTRSDPPVPAVSARSVHSVEGWQSFRGAKRVRPSAHWSRSGASVYRVYAFALTRDARPCGMTSSRARSARSRG